MHLYDFSLLPPGALSNAIVGQFSGTRQQELLVVRGTSILELWRLDPQSGRLNVYLSHHMFAVIRSVRPVRLTGSTKDYIAIGSDSGKLVILEYLPEKNVFVQVHAEIFGKSGTRRMVPGQYIAADPKGRAVMVASVEKQKFVYVLNRDAENRLTISSPLEAHKSQTIVFSIVGVDIGFENPIFACLEIDCQDVDNDATGEAVFTVEKMLTYYELDLGLNHVVRKWSDPTERSANLLIPVPGGSDGPSGVLVCSEGLITWKHQNMTDVAVPIPQRTRKDGSLQPPALIVSFASHKLKGMFFFLVQTEHGDVFKLTMEFEEQIVKNITLKYFDTLTPCISLCVFRNGFFFAVAEYGNHQLFQIESLGDDSNDIEVKSIALDKSKLSFTPRPLQNLTLVEENENLAPLIDSKVMNLTEDSTPQIYALCGRGEKSTFRIMRRGLDVSEIAESPLPGNPCAVWTVKRRKDDQYDAYIIVSFINATLVLSIGETVEEVTDTGLLSNSPTLYVQQIGEDSIVQIHPKGIRLIQSDGRNQEWSAPSQTPIVQCSCNNKQIVVGLKGGILVYFELDEMGQLNEYEERKEMGNEILCLDMDAVPEGRQRFPFMAVGLSDQTVRILSLNPENCMEPLSMQALNAAPSSLVILDMMDFVSDSLHATTYLSIGLQNGVHLRSVLDTVTGALSDTRTRFLGNRPVKLFRVLAQGSFAVLAVSSTPWLSYVHQRRYHLTPLTYEVPEYAWIFTSEQCPEGIVAVSGDTLKIVAIEKMDSEFNTASIPLKYTPRRFIMDSTTRHFIILESDHNALPYDGINGSELVGGLEQAGRGKWASCIRVLNPFDGETAQLLDLENNETPTCIAECMFHSDPTSLYFIVGSAKDMIPSPRSCSGGYLTVYRRSPHGPRLEFVHKTELDDAPTAVASFQGRCLVAVGKALRIYDLGKKKLLRKCENKDLPYLITSLQVYVDRILVTDIQESVHLVRYYFQDNRLFTFVDDTRPVWVTCATMVDYNTVALADKFGSIYIYRLPTSLMEEIDQDPTGMVVLQTKSSLRGAPYKFEHLCAFHVGELVTSIHKTVMVSGGREILIYTTLSGGIGALVPFTSREDIDMFQTLELHMRTEMPPLGGREHVKFRSRYIPVKNVIDGNLVEQYALLSSIRKRAVAEEMERSPSEVSKQIELIRTRST